LPPLPEILEALDLEALRSRSLLSLSGGERQRAFVARALAQDADHLLLDEPTAHLDLRHQVALLEVVREAAHERGKGALLVLHDLDLAARYADNLLLLHQGRLAAAGAAESVLTPERIRAVYQTNVYLFTHPATGRPSVTALPGRGADGGTATPNLTFP
jgi:iron complex transport system ATP-binding protein